MEPKASAQLTGCSARKPFLLVGMLGLLEIVGRSPDATTEDVRARDTMEASERMQAGEAPEAGASHLAFVSHGRAHQ